MNAGRILVVDDDPLVGGSCRRVLSEEGYEVDVAEGGRMGLERALDDSFDLVMTDLKMPDLDGMELVRTLKMEQPRTPVLIITGFASISSAVEATQLGCCNYIEKPFTPEEIAKAVSSALERAGREEEAGRDVEEEGSSLTHDIPISISAHHVHLAQEHVEALFGRGRELTPVGDLSQPGQFACKERVNLLGNGGQIDRVRVLGPVRDESQVEIARTEQFKLGLEAPVRMSGDLEDTPGVVLQGPEGFVELKHGVICAARHVHMAPRDAYQFDVRDREVVEVHVPGERQVTFGDVVVRVNPYYRLDMHVDTDEANAAGLVKSGVGHLRRIR